MYRNEHGGNFKMKKKSLILVLLSLGIMTGCASRIEAVPVYMEENAAVAEEETVDTLCAKEVKTIVYRDDSHLNSSGFPVTVRKESACKYGGGI